MSTAGASEKVTALLVELRWGAPSAPTYRRITDYSSDLSFQSLTYKSEPRMAIQGLEVSGIFDPDKPVQFILPREAGDVTDNATIGQRHSPISVQLWEKLLSTSGGQDQILSLFKGKIIRATRHYNGNPDMILFEGFGVKQRLAIPLGLVAGHQCQWPFGGRGCGVAVPSSTGTLSAISGKTVTVTGLPGQPSRYWHRGFIEYDGLRIEIRDWVSGNDFELMAEPPAGWLTKTVTVFAGCDKSIDVCRNRWGNEANFAGFGISMLPYSPNWELT